MAKKKDITGQKFGRLVAIRRHHSDSKNGSYWTCSCECNNNTKEYQLRKLTSGHTQSCGCLRIECHTRHSSWGTPEYEAYRNILQRCTNENHPTYKHYGGRGIKCLYESFEDFLKDVGKRPFGNLSIDRINNNGNYEKGNLRWATWSEQATNRRHLKH